MGQERQTVFVFNRTKQTFLGYRVEVADTIVSRLVGLLGRKSLQPDGGLWIVPSRGIHTLGMLFDIDVIFLDSQRRVVGVRELLRPFSMTHLSLQADSVLELPAHSVFRSRTAVGDQLVITADEAALNSDGLFQESATASLESLPRISTVR